MKKRKKKKTEFRNSPFKSTYKTPNKKESLCYLSAMSVYLFATLWYGIVATGDTVSTFSM